MNGAVGEHGRLAGRLENIDFTAHRPAHVRVGGQHPERWPQALTFRQLEARLKTAIGPLAAGRHIRCTNASRGIVQSLDPFLAGGDLESAVGDVKVVGAVGLQLIVAPAADTVLAAVTFLDIPGAGV